MCTQAHTLADACTRSHTYTGSYIHAHASTYSNTHAAHTRTHTYTHTRIHKKAKPGAAVYTVTPTQTSWDTCALSRHSRVSASAPQGAALIERSQVQCPAAAVVSLNKEIYSHCSSPPSCINGDLAVAGGSKCQAVNVSLNG